MKKASDAAVSSIKILFEDHEEEEHKSSSSSSSSSEEEEEIERELAEVSFEELQKAPSDGSHMVYQKPNEGKKTRANKNRPMKVSWKNPLVHLEKQFKLQRRFRKCYDFLFEDNLPAEREELKKQLKKTRDPKVIENPKKRISWILNLESTKSKDSAILAEHKKKEREAAKHGNKPYYLKKSEIRKQRLTEKYNDLKASGKLESFLEKRRRKNATKDHRYMPYRRPTNSEQ